MGSVRHEGHRAARWVERRAEARGTGIAGCVYVWQSTGVLSYPSALVAAPDSSLPTHRSQK